MLKNALLALASLALCGALLWWAAPRLLGPAASHLPDYDDLVAYDPARPGGHLLPGIDALVQGARRGRPVRWVTEAQGFRNDHPVPLDPAAGALRILFYGDSFVDGMRTDQAQTIGARLEALLAERLGQPVEVILSGHNNPANAWYHWQTFGRHLQPDWVLIGLTVGNDLTSHNLGAGVLPVGRAFDRMVALDASAPSAGVSDGAVLIPDDGFLPEAARSAWAVRWARCVRALGQRFPLWADAVAPAMGPKAPRPGAAQAGGFYLSLGLFYRGSIPFIERVWRDAALMLEGFVAQVRRFGARPLLVVFPTRIETLDRDWERLVRALQLDAGRFDRGAVWRRLGGDARARDVSAERSPALCGRLALPCFDAGPALRAGQRRGEVFRPLGDMHFSELGQAVVAEALAAFLLDAMAIPPVAPPRPRWLAAYRERIEAWAHARLAEEAPWADLETGWAEVRLEDEVGDDDGSGPSSDEVIGSHTSVAGGSRLAALLPRRVLGDDSDDGGAPALRTLLYAGWKQSEVGKPVWSDGSRAWLAVPVVKLQRDLELTLRVRPYLDAAMGGRQRVRLSLLDGPLADWLLVEDRFVDRVIVIPAERLTTPWLKIALALPDAIVPAAHGPSDEGRELAIAVSRLRVRPAPAGGVD